MNKRAQFYLIAAIIIILAVAGIITVKTYASATAKPRTIDSMGNELKQEGFRIVDYGIYKGINVSELLENFTENYSVYFLEKTNNANMIFVYGNKTDLYSVKYYNETTGSISADISGGVNPPTWTTGGDFVNKTILHPVLGSNTVTVTIFNKDYNFDLKDNEMFYFVIVQEKEGEVYVEKS